MSTLPGTWRPCPECGYTKVMLPGDPACGACMTSRANPEPLGITPYDFGGQLTGEPRFMTGPAALAAIERTRQWYDEDE